MRHPELAAGGCGACHETATLDEPSAGFPWTDECRAALPTVRGVRVPVPPDAQAMVDKPITLPDDFGIYARIYALEMERLNAHTGGTWTCWDQARSAECVRQQALAEGDASFCLELDPGLDVTGFDDEPTQRIPALTLREAGTWDDAGRVPFARLHPVTASELLRDADLLATIAP